MEAGIAISGSLSESCRAQAPTNCSQLARQIPRMPCWQPQPPPFDAGLSCGALQYCRAIIVSQHDRSPGATGGPRSWTKQSQRSNWTL